MRKIMLYLPAIVSTIAVVALNIILQTFSPLWYAWAALFWLGGILLNKGHVWGGLFALLPPLHILYMSTQDTGQVINESPLALISAAYILICILVVWAKSRKQP